MENTVEYASDPLIFSTLSFEKPVKACFNKFQIPFGVILFRIRRFCVEEKSDYEQSHFYKVNPKMKFFCLDEYKKRTPALVKCGKYSSCGFNAGAFLSGC